MSRKSRKKRKSYQRDTISKRVYSKVPKNLINVDRLLSGYQKDLMVETGKPIQIHIKPPLGPLRPLNLHSTKKVEVPYAKQAKRPRKVHSYTDSLQISPNQVAVFKPTVCESRSIRKQVLFASRHAGKGKKIHSKKTFTEQSKVRC